MSGPAVASAFSPHSSQLRTDHAANRPGQCAALTKLAVPRTSLALMKTGQNLFNYPALANGYAATGLARPRIDALNGTLTENDFRLIVRSFALG